MSPSESELRASLRAGEGERLDVDAVVAHARAARRDRRRNLAAIGGAVVAVLAVGGVITGVQLSRDDHKTTGAGGPSSTPQVSVSCPGSAPVMPHGNGAGPLFPDDVTSIKVCAYQVQRLSASKDVTGPAARSYAQQFNALPTRRGAQMCPQYLTQITVALIPVTPSGPAPTVVGQVGGCGTMSNGTASRDAGQLLAQLAIGASSGHAPLPAAPGHTKNHGPGPS